MLPSRRRVADLLDVALQPAAHARVRLLEVEDPGPRPSYAVCSVVAMPTTGVQFAGVRPGAAGRRYGTPVGRLDPARADVLDVGITQPAPASGNHRTCAPRGRRSRRSPWRCGRRAGLPRPPPAAMPPAHLPSQVPPGYAGARAPHRGALALPLVDVDHGVHPAAQSRVGALLAVCAHHVPHLHHVADRASCFLPSAPGSASASRGRGALRGAPGRPPASQGLPACC